MAPYLDLNPTLTNEQQELKRTTHAFATDVLRPAAAALDRLHDPRQVIDPNSRLFDVLRTGYGMGYHTMLLPKEVGGLGLSGLNLHLVLEELGWGSADFAAAFAVAGFPFASAALTQDMDLVRELVIPFVADREARAIGCWGITEPNHGSDHFALGLPHFRDPRITGDIYAVRDGNEYVINGEKSSWVSNGTIATHGLLYLTLEPSMGMAGGGVAFVPLDLPGVSTGDPLDKMGQRALNQGSIRFTDVRIPERYMLFGSAAYETVLEQTLVLTNGAMGAIFTGVARAAYEEALAHSRTRIQGGKPICEHQLVRKQLFDMFTRVETCRALSRSVVTYNDSGAPQLLEYSIAAKTYCTQTAFEVADRAVQLFGASGMNRGTVAEKLFRDARAAMIEDGANDLLALVGAARLLSRHAAAPENAAAASG